MVFVKHLVFGSSMVYIGTLPGVHQGLPNVKSARDSCVAGSLGQVAFEIIGREEG